MWSGNSWCFCSSRETFVDADKLIVSFAVEIAELGAPAENLRGRLSMLVVREHTIS